MPIFDNELLGNVSDRDTTLPKGPLASPDTKEVDTSMGGFEKFGESNSSKTGLSLEDIAKVNANDTATFDSPFQMVPRGELLDNKRYALYERGKDLENIYSLNQGWTSQLANGVVKMAATAVATFGQSFATMPNTIEAIRTGKISKLGGDPEGYEGSLDTWLKNIENVFPNYYSRAENKHPFLAAIPGFAGSANFWGDKVIKNIGFTVGAIGGAIAQDAMVGFATGGLGEIPLLGAQVGKLALKLNKIFGGVNDLEKILTEAKQAGVVGKQLLDIERIGQLAAATKIANGFRYGVNLLGASRTEAGVEARDGYRQVSEELKKFYKLQSLGEAPSAQDLQEIDKYATDAMNVRFGVNMALLTVSNAIQFDNLFSSVSKMGEKGVSGTLTQEVADAGKIGLKEGSLDTFEKKVPIGLVDKTWDFIKPKLPMIFSEGIYEEGGQYAAERGTYDYYTRKYKDSSKKTNVDNWNSLNEVIKSTHYGLAEQFGTDDGLQNMFIGALSALITGGVLGKIDNMKGKGSDARLQSVLSSLNQYGLTGILSNKYVDTLNTIGISKEMDEAAKTGDVFKYKNLKNDMFFNFVNARIPTGMHDVTIEQLQMLKDLKKEDFEKTFGMDFNTSSQKTVGSYVDTLIDKANSIKETIDALDSTFKSPFKTNTPEELENHIRFDSWKTDLAKYSSDIPDINNRLESMQRDLFKISPQVTNELAANLTNPESLKSLSKTYEKEANLLGEEITDQLSTIEKKNIKDQIKVLRTMSERVNLAINNKNLDIKTFNSLLNFELNNRDSTKTPIIPVEKSLSIITLGHDINRLNKRRENAASIFDKLSDKDGFEKYFEQAKEMAEQKVPEPVAPGVVTPTPIVKHDFTNKAGATVPVETNREYELPTTKLAKVKKLSEDRYQVTGPDGAITYKDTRDEATAVAKELNSDMAALSRVKVLALNSDGTVKVEDLSGNIQNISTDKLLGYSKVQTEQEKMSKDKDQLDRELASFLPNSGVVANNNPEVDRASMEPEPKLKTANVFFISSITESEQYEDPLLSAPHVKASREFLNHAGTFANREKLGAILVTLNQEKDLGLKGLTQLSYGESSTTNATDPNLGFVAQVFVEQDNGKTYFIDKNGERIGEVGTKVDLSKVIFQTMPTTNLYYSDGKTARYRREEENEFIAQLEAWAVKRAQLFASPGFDIKVYQFDISRGIPIELVVNGEHEKNHVSDVLATEKDIRNNQDLIQVSVSGAIPHKGKSLKFPKGRPVLQISDTLQFLHNSVFGVEKATTIYQVIKALAAEIKQQSDANQDIKLNKGYMAFLQNVLYLGKTADASGSQMYIDTNTMTIFLGGKKYAIPEIGANEKAIVDQLKDAYHNTNNTTLTKFFNSPFYEYEFKNDVLTEREWKNYQSYLLSSKNPDGSSRSISQTPLFTSVAKPSEAKPYSFEQRYSTLVDFELPVQKVKPVETAEVISTETPKVDGFVLDGKTKQTYTKLQLGNIEFTGKVEANGEISITVTENETIVKASKDVNLITNSIIPALKIADMYDPLASDQQLLSTFIANRISLELNIAKNASKIKSTPAQDIDGIFEIVAEVAKNAGVLSSFEKFQKGEGIVFTKPESIKAAEESEFYNTETQVDGALKVIGVKNPDTGEWAGIPKQGPINISRTSEPTDDYRRVGPKEAGQERMTAEELVIFKDWAKKNVPNMPYEVLDNIINTFDNKTAWGVFENNTIKFYKGALRGTEYHEAFEGIWKAFVTPEQRVAILEEFKARRGTFIDRQSGKKILFDEATDSQAKERIADDFADYRLGKLSAKTLGERISQFFKNIIEFFKSFGRHASLKEDLFKTIDTGKFKGSVITTPIEVPVYRKIEGVTETQAFEFVQDMTARAAQYIFGESKHFLYDLKKITGAEIYDRIKEAYSGDEQKYQELGEVRFRQLWKRAKENLRTIGINFNEEDKIDINDSDVSNKAYAPEPFSTDWKKTATFQIKFVAATLPEVESLNQQNSSTLQLPKRILSSVKGYMLNNFSRVFTTLLDKLSNTTSVSKTVEKLTALAKYDANYVRFFQRVGGNLATGTVSFDRFRDEDWRLFINFYQTFTKQKPNALIQYMTNGEVYTAPANLYTASKEITRRWFENIKASSEVPNSAIRYNSPTKTYQVNKEKFSKTLPKEPVDMISFLNTLGIDYSIGEYSKFNNKQKREFATAVSDIYSYLQNTKDIGSITGRTLGVNTQLNSLANLLVKVNNPNQESTYLGVDGTYIQSATENNAPSRFENEFNEASSLEELLQNRSELNDTFSKHSIVLKKGGLFIDEDGNIINELKVGYIQGSKDIDIDTGTATAKLTLGNRLTQEINQNLAGNYYILVPAESATEWMLNLGNSVSFADIETGRAWNKIYNTFRDYLKDDVALALDYKNRETLKNIGVRARELRFFKDMLSSDTLESINRMIANENTQEEIEKYIAEHASEIDAAVKSYLDNTIEDTKNLLTLNSQIFSSKDEAFSYSGLDDKFTKENKLDKFKLSTEDLNNVLAFVGVNYVISNIEMHKILFGDPYQFAIKNGKLEETKRIKSFLSPRRTTFDTPEFNTYLNKKYNTIDGIELSPLDPGYHEYKSYANTVTAKDVTLSSNEYAHINEADSFSFLMDNTYKEVKLKNQQWSDEAETWHQWQMAYTRDALVHKGLYSYSSSQLQEHDEKLISKPEPVYVTEVLKPIVSGSKNNQNHINLLVDKTSQMPIYYKAVERTNLAKLYLKMFTEGTGYVIMQSGRKVGVEQLHSLYNEDNTFNEEPFNNLIEVPWKAYGIQVENSYEHATEQTRGSQLTKIGTIDLFDNGTPNTNNSARAKDITSAYDRHNRSLDALHRNATKMLFDKLGIEDFGDHFKSDPKAVSEALEHEMLRRELSENAKDTIQLDENGQFTIPFEASTSYKQIKDILYSMVNKSLLSPKMSGSPMVQVPVTLWENSAKGRGLVLKTEQGYKKISREEYTALSEDQKKLVGLTSDTLKFYTEEDPYCEIMLPHWFKNKLSALGFKSDEELLYHINNSEDGKSILTGIGFRIPTQSLSSVEVFRVKGFLPQSMGKTIVVPSEITSKTNSDFDIDKMNTYLKSIYIDKEGTIRLVKLQGSEEATKGFYGNIFDGLLEKSRVNKNEFFDALQIRIYDLEDPKNLLKHYASIIDSLLEDVEDVPEYEDQIMKETANLADEVLQAILRERYVNDMYRRSLENEYYSSLEELLTLPENFERILAPVDDGGLSKVAIELQELQGEDEAGVKNKILSRSYMTTLRHSFVVAKKWIGIAATNITGLSVTQKAKVYIDPNRFGRIKDFDKKILGDGKIVLPHNSVKVDGQEYISLSGVMTHDGKSYISSRLSGYATAFVDVANDPFVMKIIPSDLLVGTFLFLERIGAGENTIWFLNQPIIREYMQYLDGTNSRSVFGKDNIATIRDKFPASEALVNKAEIDVKTLKSNIHDYYEKGRSEDEQANAIQQRVLSEFLKYQKMAQYAFKFSQAYNYDTTKFSNSDSFSKKQTATRIAENTNIFTSIGEILSSNFIGEQVKELDTVMDSMGSILKLEEPEFVAITDEVLAPYKEKEFISNDDFNKVATKIKASFLDYIIQIKKNLGNQINMLMISEDSVANQLIVARQNHPEVKILNDLQVVSSDRVGGAKTIKLQVNNRDAYDENLYVGMMRELKTIEPVLYSNIIKLALLQGSYQSSISIKNIIPVEDYAKEITPIIRTLVATKEIRDFALGWFQRNNFKDNSIMPRVQPKFFTTSEFPIAEDMVGADIYQYYSPAFPNVANFKAQSLDRKILLLNPKYHSSDVVNDFIKVPRVVTDKQTGERIDMKTGQSITNSMFAQKRASGDLSLREVYGYQKVKYSNENPLITNKGEYVYKLINLYGEGTLTSEYYDSFKPSSLNNGTIKINQEISDRDIINNYAPTAEQEKLSQNTEETLAPWEEVVNTPIVEETFTEEKEISSETSNEVNIFAGIGANSELSNFALRPFTSSLSDGTFNTVEGAFQAAKFMFTDKNYDTEGNMKPEAQDIYEKLKVATGVEARNLGRKITGLKVAEWDAQSSQVMETLLYESFSQNPIAAQKLLDTGTAKLAHNGPYAKDKWTTEFPRLLTNVRTDLAKSLSNRTITVDQTKITLDQDGKMYYGNGHEVTDQTTKNKVTVRKELQDGTLRVSSYNEANYFVLSDGRIVGSGKTNLGKESITDSKIKEKILAKAVLHKKQC